jgi:hypothetical protein
VTRQAPSIARPSKATTTSRNYSYPAPLFVKLAVGEQLHLSSFRSAAFKTSSRCSEFPNISCNNVISFVFLLPSNFQRDYDYGCVSLVGPSPMGCVSLRDDVAHRPGSWCGTSRCKKHLQYLFGIYQSVLAGASDIAILCPDAPCPNSEYCKP